MPASEQPLTGFEGVQDSLLYDTLRQAQYQQRVLQQRQMENPFDRAIDAFGGLVSIGVDQIAPPLAERNARAVSTARANALRSVEGQNFESPFARQIAVVEAAADELDSQGLGSSAEQLRANVLALRQQQLEFRRLGAAVTKEESQATTESNRAKYSDQQFGAEARGAVATADKSELDAAITAATAEDQIKQARLQTASDEQDLATKVFNNTTGRDLEIANVRSQIEDRRARLALARSAEERAGMGDVKAITLPDGRIIAANVLPGGRAVYEERDPRTGQPTQKVLLSGEYAPAQLSGSRDEVSDTTRRLVNQRGASTTTALRNMLGIREVLVQSGGQAGTAVGKIAQQLAGTRTEIRAAVRAIGGQEALQDADARVAKFLQQNEAQLDALERQGIQRDVVEALMSDVMYNIATSREGGRTTDQDVQYAGLAAGFSAATVTGRLAAQDNMAYQMRMAAHDAYAMAGLPEPRALQEAGRAYGEAIGRAPVANPANPIFNSYYNRITSERQRRLRQGGTVENNGVTIRQVK